MMLPFVLAEFILTPRKDGGMLLQQRARECTACSWRWWYLKRQGAGEDFAVTAL